MRIFKNVICFVETKMKVEVESKYQQILTKEKIKDVDD